METINKNIREQDFKRVYLLYGESYLKRQYCNLLVNEVANREDSLNYHKFQGKEVSFPKVIDIAETIPFLADYKVIVIENSGACNQSSDQIADYIPTIPESTILIFIEEEVKTNTRLYKAIKKHGHCAWFHKQSQEMLKSWIKNKLISQGKTITRDGLGLFIEKTIDMDSDKEREKATKSTEMDYMNMELEKVISYAYHREVITVEDIEAIVHGKLHDRVFDMFEAIVTKNQKEALRLYYDLLSLKEPPLKILAILAGQFNARFQMKLLKEKNYNDAQISEEIGIQRYWVSKQVLQVRGVTSKALRDALEECVETESRIKSGRMDETMGLELLIIKYSSK